MAHSLIEDKLGNLPTTPGVYFHKDKSGEIIYIGKAANLRSRVKQYFQKRRPQDLKTHVLVKEIADLDWMELESEVDALFFEAELVRRYQPRFNILLRDDKSSQYIRIDYKSEYPTVTLVRRPIDDGANYFGPYLNSLAVKRALRYLRRAFPYATARSAGQKRASLHYHLGLDPGLEDGRTSLEEYRKNLRKLMQYLRGEKVTLVKSIEKEMQSAAKKKDFEQAAKLRNQLFAIKELNRQILFSDRENIDLSRDQAMAELISVLNLKKIPKRIEGFDISHMQGTDNVASMVVFINGTPDKAAYRKFKMRHGGNDDFAHMKETLGRRLSEKNRAKWGEPDLVLIDGGKGQLSAAIAVRDELSLQKIPMIGLAKRREEIIIHKGLSYLGIKFENIVKAAAKAGAQVFETGDFLNILLPSNSGLIKFLGRVRDESHRFAVSYHSSLRRRRQTASILDEIPGVGPATKKKLIRHFGSAKGVLGADLSQLQKLLGSQRGLQVSEHLNSFRQTSQASKVVGTIKPI